jgi:histidine triad (HIT) family protein
MSTTQTTHTTPSHSQPHASDEHCIFCKIVAGSIPSKKVYEDQDLLAFHDINPWAPIHFLIIPKTHIASMAQLTPAHEALMGKIMVKAGELALSEGAGPYPEGGFRTVVNTGRHGGQEVHHLHVHVLAGERPWQKI